MDIRSLEEEIDARRVILGNSGRLSKILTPIIPQDSIALNDEIGRGGFSVVYSATIKKILASNLNLERVPLAAKCYTFSNINQKSSSIDDAISKLVARFVTIRDDTSITKNNPFAEHLVLPFAYSISPQTLTVLVEQYNTNFGDFTSILRRNLKDKKEIGKRLLPVFTNAVKGIDALHKGGYRHQDIKSTNLLVNYNSDLHPTKVGWTDFEIIGLDGPEIGDGATEIMSEKGVMLGTPRYWPPSLILGEKTFKDITPILDSYALGLMMAESLFEINMRPPTEAIAKTKVAHQTSFRKWDHLEQIADEYGLPGIERIIIKLTDEERGYVQ